LALYDTENSDAMYLAGLSVNPKLMEKKTLQNWVKKADWHMLAEYTVAGVATESPLLRFLLSRRLSRHFSSLIKLFKSGISWRDIFYSLKAL